MRYVCETDVTAKDLKAAVRDGTLRFWRLDIDGRRWFKSMPVIHGVPRDAIDAQQVEADDDDPEVQAHRAESLEFLSGYIAGQGDWPSCDDEADEDSDDAE